ANAKDDLRLPDAIFLFTDTFLVFDNLRHRLLVIANARIEGHDDQSLDQAYDRAALKIGMTLQKLARPARTPAPLSFAAPGRCWRLAKRASPRRWTSRHTRTPC